MYTVEQLIESLQGHVAAFPRCKDFIVKIRRKDLAIQIGPPEGPFMSPKEWTGKDPLSADENDKRDLVESVTRKFRMGLLRSLNGEPSDRSPSPGSSGQPAKRD